jgi:hypothetical protein
MAMVQIEDDVRLHGIVGPEPVLARRPRRAIEQGGG